jgi:Zn-dependent protease
LKARACSEELVFYASYAAYNPARTRLSKHSQLTGFVNLFNLTPVWQLDRSRGFHALTRSERCGVVAAIVVALLLSAQRLLFIVGGVAVWRALQRDAGPGDRQTFATFVVLVIALSLLTRDLG